MQARFRKGRETWNKIANIHCILEKAREFQKDIFCFTDYTKTFDSVDHNKLWKILKEMVVPDQLPVSWETCMQVKKQPLEPDAEQWTNSKLGKVLCPMSESPSGKREGLQVNATGKKGKFITDLSQGPLPHPT